MGKLRSIISKYRSSKDAKIVANNFIWLLMLQCISYIFPLITIPYLSRTIGIEGFGKISFAASIMIWIQTFSDWGFNLTAARDVAQNRNNLVKVSEIFTNVFYARMILMIISFVILLILIAVIPPFRGAKDIILISFLIIPGHILFPDWFFQAMEKMKYITIFNVLVRLIFTLAIFIFIKDSDDYILQPLLSSFGYIICGILSFYIIMVKWKVRLTKTSIKNVINYIKASTSVFVNNIAPNMYNSFSIILLGSISGNAAVGVYDGGYKFIQISNQVLSILERAFYPYLSRKIDKHTVFLKINILISSMMAVLLFVLAPWIVKFFLTAEFYDSILIIRILSISVIFRAISNVYGKNYLIIKHQEKNLSRITVMCSIIAFVLSWPLIYNYDYIGAAITMNLGMFLMALITFIVASKYKKQKIDNNYV